MHRGEKKASPKRRGERVDKPVCKRPQGGPKKGPYCPKGGRERPKKKKKWESDPVECGECRQPKGRRRKEGKKNFGSGRIDPQRMPVND